MMDVLKRTYEENLVFNKIKFLSQNELQQKLSKQQLNNEKIESQKLVTTLIKILAQREKRTGKRT